ncbi:nitroreductase/quinone reductase family protein [Saccharomonospora xinjiangensis]|uniref:nitroreductase/quinone reductase family protein n=1 Tax=Saccharomonospora xinjiangensis TaxID=75294 RepID=UPI00350F9C73
MSDGAGGNATTRYLRPGRAARAMNRVVAALTRRGMSLWGSRILSVAGRTTGILRSTPVNVLTLDGEQYLVAARGNTEWVRNLRAAGIGKLSVGKREEWFEGIEILDDDRLPVLRAYLRRWAWEVGAFFDGVTADASDDELRTAAAKHPVFRIKPARAPEQG